MGLRPLDKQKSFFDVEALFAGLLKSSHTSPYSDPRTGRFVFFAEQIYPELEHLREQMEKMYCVDNGRPAEEPVEMMGATILQFMERLPDRHAAEACGYDLRWKLALHLTADKKAFHHTSLVKFRERLVAHGLENAGFEGVVDLLVEKGWIKKRSKQRLDSTHIIGLVSQMSRLECVRETIRLALQGLEKGVGQECPRAWGSWWERYVESKVDYKSSVEVFRLKMLHAGQDIQEIVAWIGTLSEELQQGEQVRLLKRVFEENFEVVTGGQLLERRAQPAGAVCNPHEPEAQWSKKSTSKDTQWVGHKVQIAETVEDEPRGNGEPTKSLIVSMVTQAATESEKAGMEQTLQEQHEQGMEKPSELYVDGAYTSGQALKEAHEEGRELMGPAPASPDRGKVYPAEKFKVDLGNRQAVCPAGQISTQCSRLEEKETGKVSYRFEWGTVACQGCALRTECVSRGQTHRTVTVGEHHMFLQGRRGEMQTEAFKQKMKRRNGIEGSVSELVRGYGLRKARYRGQGKVRLQNYMIGAACNVKRWFRRMVWEAQQAAHHSEAEGMLPAALTASG